MLDIEEILKKEQIRLKSIDEWIASIDFDSAKTIIDNKENNIDILNLKSTIENVEIPDYLLELLHTTISVSEAKYTYQLENDYYSFSDIFLSKKNNSFKISSFIKTIEKIDYSLIKNIKIDQLINLHKKLNLANDNFGFRNKNYMYKFAMRNRITNDGSFALIPPQEERKIKELMLELMAFINSSKLEKTPLIKCALIHLRFEMIHPFSDGNGRVGRILNDLMLKKYDLNFSLFLAMNQTLLIYKNEYFNLLKNCFYNNCDKKSLDLWINWFIKKYFISIKITNQLLLKLLIAQKEISEFDLKAITKNQARSQKIKVFLSQTICFNKNDFMNNLNISEKTAARIIKELTKSNLIIKNKLAKIKTLFYLNKKYLDVLNNEEANIQVLNKKDFRA